MLSALRGAQVTHYINADSPVPSKEILKSTEKPTELISNPDYEAWVAKDQQIFNYLLSSISREIMVHVSTCTTAAEIWKVIQDMTAS